jgi:putative peptidoglycan lipid II flippase
MLVIALATGVSRIFGLVREMVIAHEFGAGAHYDAFVIAFMIPHILRMLLAEGALSAAFIPLLAERLARGRELASRFAGNLLTVALIVFPAVVAVGVWLAPHYIPFLADGFSTAKQQLAVRLTILTFPFIMLVGLAAIAMGVLQSSGRFFAPAFAPVFFNLGLIAGALLIAPHLEPPILGLAWGVLLGGLGQLLFQIPFLRGCLGLRLVLDLRDEGLRRLAGLMLPMVLGLIVVELNMLVDNKLASRLGDGNIASLQYALRLFQLPLGLFAIALATALLPQLSRHSADQANFVASLRQGLRLAAFILLPAIVGLVVLGRPIIALLFEHGRFTPQDTARTLYVLRFLAIGLIGYGMSYLLTRAFYALKDTRTPVMVSALAVGLNIALDYLLIGPLGVGGLALATSIAGLAQLALLVLVLQRRLRRPLIAPIAPEVGMMLINASIMGVVVYGADLGLIHLGTGELARVMLGVVTGMISYGALALRGPLPALRAP